MSQKYVKCCINKKQKSVDFVKKTVDNIVQKYYDRTCNLSLNCVNGYINSKKQKNVEILKKTVDFNFVKWYITNAHRKKDVEWSLKTK